MSASSDKLVRTSFELFVKKFTTQGTHQAKGFFDMDAKKEDLISVPVTYSAVPDGKVITENVPRGLLLTRNANFNSWRPKMIQEFIRFRLNVRLHAINNIHGLYNKLSGENLDQGMWKEHYMLDVDIKDEAQLKSEDAELVNILIQLVEPSLLLLCDIQQMHPIVKLASGVNIQPSGVKIGVDFYNLLERLEKRLDSVTSPQSALIGKVEMLNTGIVHQDLDHVSPQDVYHAMVSASTVANNIILAANAHMPEAKNLMIGPYDMWTWLSRMYFGNTTYQTLYDILMYSSQLINPVSEPSRAASYFIDRLQTKFRTDLSNKSEAKATLKSAINVKFKDQDDKNKESKTEEPDSEGAVAMLAKSDFDPKPEWRGRGYGRPRGRNFSRGRFSPRFSERELERNDRRRLYPRYSRERPHSRERQYSRSRSRSRFHSSRSRSRSRDRLSNINRDKQSSKRDKEPPKHEWRFSPDGY